MPRSIWFKALLLFVALWAPLSQAETGWQPIQETIRKSDKDNRQYQAIRLDNGMVVLLVSDPQAVKSLSALVVPVGSLEDPEAYQGLAHYLEHMSLMGSKKYPQADSLAEYLKMHGGSHNASTAPYRTAFYLEVENDALPGAVDRLADAIAEPLLDKKYAERERNAVNAELTMARTRDGMRMAQVSAETINPAHPGSKFSGGNLETLSDKPGNPVQQALKDFHEKYYSANLMKAVIYSNKPLPELAKMAADTFGRVPNKESKKPEITVPVVTDAQKGIIIHYVPALPRKVLRVEFRIDNNSAKFRSKTDELITYLIGNRSPGTLSDWLQKQGLVEGISANSDPIVNGNSGVLAISASLTDKGLANRDQVVAAIFSYLNLLREKGIDKQYFDELANVLDIDFRYPSITRDMDYVEWLADTMIRVPVEHTLDAVNIADRYDAKAVKERLAMMTPQNARIWYISPKEPHNKTAYFVDAPYQVDKISEQTFADWQKKAANIALSLPELNPYIPDDFSLIKSEKKYDHPELIVDESNLRVVYAPSRYFASEPKADVSLILRNPKAMDSARNQVMFALNDYLAGLALDQLSNQASVGGISFSTNANNGLMVNANGYTQRLPQLFQALLEGYFSYTATEDQLEQAKSWYNQMMDSAEKGKAFEQAIMPAQMLSQVPYFSRDERRKILPSITLKEVLAYRDALKSGARPEFMVIGNMTEAQATTLARHVPTQGYQLGAKLIEFGARALESTSLYEIAQPVLQRLARYTLDTVHLGIVEGDEVLYLEKINSQRGLEMRSRPGHRMPLAITGIGKALILNRTEEEWRTLFKTCGDETKLGAFIQNMRRYAASGFAFDLEENEPTIRCVAAPVYNARDEIVAAISVASTTTYMSLARLEELAPYVKSCAEEISAELGWGKHVRKDK